MSLINKMNVGNTDYDIQDRLMPDAIGQVGQVLKVKDDGSGLEFSTIESGGNVYMHSMEFKPDSSAVTAYFLYFYSTFNTSITLDNILEYSLRIPFGSLNHIDDSGQFISDGVITSIQSGPPGKFILTKPGAGTQITLEFSRDEVTEV